MFGVFLYGRTFRLDAIPPCPDTSNGTFLVERLRENLADFDEKLSKKSVNRVLESFRWTGCMSRPGTNFLGFLKSFSQNPPSFPATALPLYPTSLFTGDLNAIRKQKCFICVLSTEGRVVGLCWEHLKPKGPGRQQRSVTVLEIACNNGETS